MRSLIFTFLIAIAVTSASAANWQKVVADDNFTVFVDTESISVVGRKARAWARWVYTTPVSLGDAVPGRSFRSTVALTAYQCAERSYLDLQAFAYADPESLDKVHETAYADIPARYRSPPPESNGETIMLFVCKAAGLTKK